MTGYAKGGFVEGTGAGLAFVPTEGEQVARADGTVLRFEACNGGLALVPTGEQIDIRAALRNIRAQLEN